MSVAECTVSATRSMNVSAPGLPAGELDGRGRPERVLAGVPGAVGDVELEVVALHGEEFGARGGVGAGQVGYGHDGQLPMRCDDTRLPPGATGSRREQAGADPDWQGRAGPARPARPPRHVEEHPTMTEAVQSAPTTGPRGLLVRPAVPVGLADQPLGARGGQGARHRPALARHVAGRPQPRPRPARGLPGDDGAGDRPGAGRDRRRRRSTATRSSATSTPPWARSGTTRSSSSTT